MRPVWLQTDITRWWVFRGKRLCSCFMEDFFQTHWANASFTSHEELMNTEAERAAGEESALMLRLFAGWSSAAHMNNMWLFKLHEAAADPPRTLPTLRDQTRAAAFIIDYLQETVKMPITESKVMSSNVYSVYRDIKTEKSRNSSQRRSCNQRSIFSLKKLLIANNLNCCRSIFCWRTDQLIN